MLVEEAEVLSVSQLPFPAFISNEKGIIVQANNLFDKVVDEEEVVNRSFTELFVEWNFLGNEENLIHARRGEVCFLFIKNKILENHFLYIGLNTKSLYELQQKVKQLEILNREYDTIVENSYDGIYITDRNGVTLKTNPAIERITGIPKEYYLGKSVDWLVKRGILKDSVTQRVVTQKRTVSVVQENYEGKETLLTGNPVFNEDGEIEKIVTNIRDLSELNELLNKIKEANELKNKYKKEIDKLKRQDKLEEGVYFVSEKMELIYQMADRIADVDATVLILGETGVGKDVLARYIFQQSERSKQGDFIKINCGAIPPELLESELFGYESGAFTGANKKGKPGLFELANKGVLFLDEIGELPLHLQVKLLRVLQEREIQRIGGTKSIKVDVRVVAATNRNLKEMVNNGTFREDLFYRLNVIPISIPPLRKRKDDILPLTNLFLERKNKEYNLDKTMSAALKDFFYSFDWPGNVRELLNLIERLVLTSPNKAISTSDLPDEYINSNDQNSHSQSAKSLSLKEAVEMAEKEILTEAIQKYKSTYEVAKELKSSQATIVRKLQKYNLKFDS